MKLLFRLSFLALAVLTLYSCKKETAIISSQNRNYGELYAVRGKDAGIYDKDGRFVLLRGVNYNALGDYWQANKDIPATAAYDPEQFEIMASYGFNCVRLLFSWSALEPVRGEYNKDYIQQIKRTIQDARKSNIYIILDMHQDAYSKYIFSTSEDNCEFPQKGWDGAPDWACITDGASTCSNNGSRENCDAVVRAWENLWNDTDGILTSLLNAWSYLIAGLGQEENLIAYNIINEPSLGSSSLTSQQAKLTQFYGNFVKTVIATEKRQNLTERMIFFEPAVTWNGNEIPSVAGGDFTRDDNIVFAPHNYFEVISNVLTMEQGFSLYQALADAYHTGCFIGEYGVYSNSEDDIEKLNRFAQLEDKLKMGSTFWQWAQAPGDPHGISWDGQDLDVTTTHLMQLDRNGNYTGVRNNQFLKILGRTRPTFVTGKNIKYQSNPESQSFTLSAFASSEGITELWIPNFSNSEPVIKGENIEDIVLQEVSGGYKVSVKVKGSYSIEIS